MIKLFLVFLIFSHGINAAETCSRIATINYQEVLVDAGSGKLGEGLRFYLEKDSNSKKLLDEYQQKSAPTIISASASTAGSLLILGGLLSSSNQGRANLIYGGAILIALSYLTSKTLQYNNEELLQKSIEQYNKRNRPHIYFSPLQDNNGSPGFGVGLQKGF